METSLAPAYALAEPLPADVIAPSADTLGGYRRYPVFSARWLRGRTLLIAPIVGGLGLVQSAEVGLVLHSWRLFWLTAAVSPPIWILFVVAGPLLATLVRHRHWPLGVERTAISVAVAIGVAVSFAGQQAANVFSSEVLLPPLKAAMPGFNPQLWNKPAPQLVMLVLAVQVCLFAALGGAVALLAYLREHRRWQGAQQARALAQLRRQKSESDLRLSVLQAQVEPHFLFNTLSSVHALIRQDPARAEATVEALVDHLRATMPRLRRSLDEALTTLAEQIEVCRSYLGVMQVRMGARLRWSIDLPPALAGCEFPPLLLISLVENAIKHGLEPRPQGGNLVISACVDAGQQAQLAVSVTDDGVGLRPGAAGGVGLANVRAQLEARYQGHASLTLRPRAAGGAIATIRIPCTRAAA
ncbi:MAG TPA: histidine kinase [Steroidobacteraceae bacterium]|nr:histidine kinase [Steroidobacteraceae bacterium]